MLDARLLSTASAIVFCTYRRVQPYIVNGPVPIPHSEKSPLKKNNENSRYLDDSHVI